MYLVERQHYEKEDSDGYSWHYYEAVELFFTSQSAEEFIKNHPTQYKCSCWNEDQDCEESGYRIKELDPH